MSQVGKPICGTGTLTNHRSACATLSYVSGTTYELTPDIVLDYTNVAARYEGSSVPNSSMQLYVLLPRSESMAPVVVINSWGEPEFRVELWFGHSNYVQKAWADLHSYHPTLTESLRNAKLINCRDFVPGPSMAMLDRLRAIFTPDTWSPLTIPYVEANGRTQFGKPGVVPLGTMARVTFAFRWISSHTGGVQFTPSTEIFGRPIHEWVNRPTAPGLTRPSSEEVSIGTQVPSSIPHGVEQSGSQSVPGATHVTPGSVPDRGVARQLHYSEPGSSSVTAAPAATTGAVPLVVQTDASHHGVGGVIYYPGTGPYANASHGSVPQPPARVEVPTLPVTTQSPVSLIDAPIVPVEETVPVSPVPPALSLSGALQRVLTSQTYDPRNLVDSRGMIAYPHVSSAGTPSTLVPPYQPLPTLQQSYAAPGISHGPSYYTGYPPPYSMAPPSSVAVTSGYAPAVHTYPGSYGGSYGTMPTSGYADGGHRGYYGGPSYLSPKEANSRDKATREAIKAVVKAYNGDTQSPTRWVDLVNFVTEVEELFQCTAVQWALSSEEGGSAHRVVHTVIKEVIADPLRSQLLIGYDARSNGTWAMRFRSQESFVREVLNEVVAVTEVYTFTTDTLNMSVETSRDMTVSDLHLRIERVRKVGETLRQRGGAHQGSVLDMSGAIEAFISHLKGPGVVRYGKDILRKVVSKSATFPVEPAAHYDAMLLTAKLKERSLLTTDTAVSARTRYGRAGAGRRSPGKRQLAKLAAAVTSAQSLVPQASLQTGLQALALAVARDPTVKRTCWTCNSEDHIQRNCPEFLREKAKGRGRLRNDGAATQTKAQALVMEQLCMVCAPHLPALAENAGLDDGYYTDCFHAFLGVNPERLLAASDDVQGNPALEPRVPIEAAPQHPDAVVNVACTSGEVTPVTESEPGELTSESSSDVCEDEDFWPGPRLGASRGPGRE